MPMPPSLSTGRPDASEHERVARLLASGVPTRAPDRVWWIWLVYAALYAVSIPWYLPGGPPRLWLGLPHWVVISLAALAGVATFTVWVVRRHWAADEPAADARRFDHEDDR